MCFFRLAGPRHSLQKILQNTKNDILHTFKDDKFILVLLADRKITGHAQQVLLSMRMHKRNDNVSEKILYFISHFNNLIFKAIIIGKTYIF